MTPDELDWEEYSPDNFGIPCGLQERYGIIEHELNKSN
jgi:hypothetical protein